MFGKQEKCLNGKSGIVAKEGMGSHQSKDFLTQEWLTPPWIIKRLGIFDLDPCAPIVRPWPTAERHYTIEDNGLILPWEGRVWLNPPYKDVDIWLQRLVKHGDGIALIFARTETTHFFRSVWGSADGVLFIKGRISFHHVDGTISASNSGAPSVLVAYGEKNAKCLLGTNIPGAFISGHEVMTIEGLFRKWNI